MPTQRVFFYIINIFIIFFATLEPMFYLVFTYVLHGLVVAILIISNAIGSGFFATNCIKCDIFTKRFAYVREMYYLCPDFVILS